MSKVSHYCYSQLAQSTYKVNRIRSWTFCIPVTGSGTKTSEIVLFFMFLCFFFNQSIQDTKVFVIPQFCSIHVCFNFDQAGEYRLYTVYSLLP